MNASPAGSCWASCAYGHHFSFLNTGSVMRGVAELSYEQKQRRLGRAIQDDLGYGKRIERVPHLLDNLFVGSSRPGDVSCCLQSPFGIYF